MEKSKQKKLPLVALIIHYLLFYFRQLIINHSHRRGD
jgi:hypothetical protein